MALIPGLPNPPIGDDFYVYIGDNFYLFIFVFAIFIMGVLGLFLGIFKNNILNQLSTRITILMLASGPIVLVLIPLANKIIQGVGTKFAFIIYVLIALIVPIALGHLGSRFVRRPLRDFSDTVASLKQNNYKTKLKPTGVTEFDKVFSEFNDLIERLQQEEKLRKDLISDTSHELNTPLTILIGQLTAVQEGKLSVTKKRIATMKEQTERLAELVQQLDTYTKARTRSAGERENIQLLHFCQDLVSHFKQELEQKNITVKLNIKEAFVLHANHNALWSILANLMQNTLRYSNATELVITMTADTLTFYDNGKGVPSEALPYLFERFYRVDKSRNQASGGLGLGLAIVKELAEQQGWHIDARQTEPGLEFVLEIT